MWTEFWTIEGWEDGYEGNPPDLVKDLVGSGRGALAIWAADEAGSACVTVESYTRRPPLETSGWEEVVEVRRAGPLLPGDVRVRLRLPPLFLRLLRAGHRGAEARQRDSQGRLRGLLDGCRADVASVPGRQRAQVAPLIQDGLVGNLVPFLQA